jgi:hypothetical protein
MFTSGVPYLSRKEEVNLRAKQQNSAIIADIALPPGTTEYSFYRRAKNIVKKWVDEFENHRTKVRAFLLFLLSLSITSSVYLNIV